MDTSDSKIVFDDKGVCDHCKNYYENILPTWNHGEGHQNQLDEMLERIRRQGDGKKYDCLLGLSGGLDSSYLAYIAVKKWELRPKFISINTGWNLTVADENIEKLKNALGIEVETITVDWESLKELHRAYFYSQVPYQDNPQDLALFAVFYNFAVSNGFKSALNGGNHSTECIREPVEWTHINDPAQVKDIFKKFGRGTLDNYPMLSMFKKFIYYKFIKKLNIEKPLDLIHYNKQEAIELLNTECGWQPYQHKHYENRFTRFYEGYWLYNKFNIDKRRAYYSSLILTGQISRDEVDEMLKQPPYNPVDAEKDLEIIASKLDFTKKEFISLMKQPNKSWRDYKSNYMTITLAIKMARLVGLEKRNYR